MNGRERCAAAMDFRQVDRVPRFLNSFWEGFVSQWRQRHGHLAPTEFCANDLFVVVADETAWPTRASRIEDRGDEWIQRTGWGVVERCTAQTEFSEALETAVSGRVDPDSLDFDDPRMDRRYAAALEQAEEKRDEFYVMCKTGGPYLRAATMRGDEEFWMDIADDPSWARAFVDRVAEHITTVGVESIRRLDLRDTGIAIYDDVASNRGVFVGPATYEAVFLPALRRMVRAYREAGATKIMHHSDGDVSLLLDMWIDAGIDAINPVEYRAGMDPVAIRRKYGKQLVCVGGLDNAAILPRGDRVEIRDHISHLMGAAGGSGFIIAPHSIGPDISVETFEYVVELLDELGAC